MNTNGWQCLPPLNRIGFAHYERLPMHLDFAPNNRMLCICFSGNLNYLSVLLILISIKNRQTIVVQAAESEVNKMILLFDVFTLRNELSLSLE